MEIKKEKLQLITCPSCHGTGFIGKKICSSCQGRGIFNYFFGHIIYWEEGLSEEHIFLQGLRRVFNFLINLFLVLLGILGILILIKRFFGLEELGPIINYFTPDKEKQLLLFWFSFLFDLYFIYRLKRKSEIGLKTRVIHFNPEKELKEEEIVPTFEEILKMKEKNKINISGALSPAGKKLIYQSWKIARKFSHQEIAPVHLFISLIYLPEIRLLLNRLGTDWAGLKEKISLALARQKKEKAMPFLSSETKKFFFKAYNYASLRKQNQINPREILLGLISEEGIIKDIFYDLEIDLDEINNVIIWLDIQDKIRGKIKKFKSKARIKPKGTMNKALTAVATPFLDQFSRDLTALARAGYLPLCVARDEEIENIFRLIEAGKNGFVLVGYPEVGKMSIIEGIAQLMVSEEVPKRLKDKRLVSLSISSLVGGASQIGEIEGRLQRIMFEVSRAGNIALFIDDVHNMIGVTTSGGKLDLSEVLAEGISRNFFVVITTSNPVDYRRYLESKSLGNALEKIEVNEPAENQTIQILEAKAGNIEYQQEVYFSYDAISQAVKLSSRYIKERFLPQKAIDLLEEVAVYVRKKRGKKSIILGEDIAELVARKTNIPVAKITEKEAAKLLGLEDKIHERIIDQARAVKAVSSALRRARAELREIKKPIVNLLFLGPTGVGKTELAKTVAEIYFGSEDRMIRLDMSEYQEKSSIDRLIGVPGQTGGGLLTEAARKNPFSLLLLDELEKAHPEILNIFLQVMEDGRLTDNEGRTVDFTNIILIATSNAGTSFIQDEIEKNTPTETIKEVLIKEKLKSYFKPEFLNRFDDIVVFKSLTLEEIEQISVLLLNKLKKQMLEKGITLEVSLEAIKELTQAGFDPSFGARPLKRVIQERVNDALANYLLRGKLGRRDIAILKPGGVIEVKKAEKI